MQLLYQLVFSLRYPMLLTCLLPRLATPITGSSYSWVAALNMKGGDTDGNSSEQSKRKYRLGEWYGVPHGRHFTYRGGISHRVLRNTCA